MANEIVSINRKTARQLVIQQNSTLDLVENPKTGKCYFVCGDVRGYASPAAVSLLAKGGTIDEFQYAEIVSIKGEKMKDQDGNDRPMPCLMVVGNSQQNVKASIGAELLH